jgi:hypothetical protein
MAKGEKKAVPSHKHVRRAAKKKECQVKGCKNAYRAKGYCDEHYKLWREGSFGKSRYQICSKEGCRKPTSMQGLCEVHLAEKRGTGAAKAAASEAAPSTPPAAPPSAG